MRRLDEGREPPWQGSGELRCLLETSLQFDSSLFLQVTLGRAQQQLEVDAREALRVAQERARRFGEGSERMTGSQTKLTKLQMRLIPQELLAELESLRINKHETQTT